MKTLDLTDSENYTNAKVMGTICEGLAEVCEMMVTDGRFRSQKQIRVLREYASEFSAFSRWWLRQDMINKAKISTEKPEEKK